jgi:hypothetical protein
VSELDDTEFMHQVHTLQATREDVAVRLRNVVLRLEAHFTSEDLAYAVLLAGNHKSLDDLVHKVRRARMIEIAG